MTLNDLNMNLKFRNILRFLKYRHKEKVKNEKLRELHSAYLYILASVQYKKGTGKKLDIPTYLDIVNPEKEETRIKDNETATETEERVLNLFKDYHKEG